MNQRINIVITLLLCVGCAGPTKTGKEARVRAHQRMDMVNADLAAQQARQQFEVGQLDKAIETISAAIDRFKLNADYYLLQGRILLEQHHLDSARKSFEHAVSINPEMAEPYYFLGILYQRWSDDESALEAYGKAMEHDPSHPQYIMAYSETLVALGKYEEALKVLIGSGNEFQHQPAVPSLLGQIYLSLGDAETAAQHLSDSILLGNDDIEALMSLATAQFQAGMYADCLATLNLLEEREEGLIQTYSLMKGKALAATGRLIEGRDICLMITRLTPEKTAAWIDLGYIAWDMGDYKRLEKCGLQITQLDNELPEGALFQGIAALHLGDSSRAAIFLSQVQTDNESEDLAKLLASIGFPSKTVSETLIEPNTQSDSAEGSWERFQSNSSIVHVPQDSTHTP